MKYAIAFLLGVTISGATTWYCMRQSGERVLELLMVVSETASLDFYSELQKANDDEIKCFLAKHAASIASNLNEADAVDSPLLGPPGLGPFTATNILQAKDKFASSGAENLAKNCSTKTKLFK